MFDAAFLEQCAAPGIRIEIVERFVAAVGTENPLAISITSGDRVILPEPPKSAEEAARLAQRFVAQAVVRGGVTQFPIGVGISDASEINADVFDACKNITMGTALFDKVYRIVAHTRGSESGAVAQEAIEAWRTGQFEGNYVFAQPDPGRLRARAESEDARPHADPEGTPREPLDTAEDPNMAEIRVVLPASVQ